MLNHLLCDGKQPRDTDLLGLETRKLGHWTNNKLQCVLRNFFLLSSIRAAPRTLAECARGKFLFVQ